MTTVCVETAPCGDTGHQGEVGDESVHRAEHRRTQPASVHITVRVVVTVGLVQWRLSFDDGHGSPLVPAGRVAPATPNTLENTRYVRGVPARQAVLTKACLAA